MFSAEVKTLEFLYIQKEPSNQNQCIPSPCMLKLLLKKTYFYTESSEMQT